LTANEVKQNHLLGLCLMSGVRIEKPIFIIGVARSGTTIFYNMLATHPAVAWFSNYSNKFRIIPQTPVIHRLLDLPIVGEIILKNILSRKGSKLTPRPNEGEEIYQDMCGFPYNTQSSDRERFKTQEERMCTVIESHLKYSGRCTFVSKQTANNRRLRLLNGMFPDARFIHIIRDGRAIANSIVRADWWPKLNIWWLNKTAEEIRGDQIELGLRYWEKTLAGMLEDAQVFEDRYFEFRYEDLVVDVWGMFGRIFEYLGWPLDEKFLHRLPESLPNMNYKWQQEFSYSQKQTALALIGPMLARLGYLEESDV
jgi:hypothetical protein